MPDDHTLDLTEYAHKLTLKRAGQHFDQMQKAWRTPPAVIYITDWQYRYVFLTRYYRTVPLIIVP